MTSLEQYRAIHTLRKKIGIADDDYRGLIQKLFHKSSSKQLGFDQAAMLIGELRKLAGPGGGFRSPGETATGQYAKALQALWIAAFNLGIVRDRTDKAMLAFVERQCGVSHTRFLVDAADARKAIEGLKAWISREAELAWPKESAGVLARKRVVVDAQEQIMRKKLPTFDAEQFGTLKGYGSRLASYDAAALDTLSRAIGRMIRGEAAQAKRKAA